MLAAMCMAAERLGLSFERFCRDVAVLTHGTTVGTNTLIQRKGARVGMITTRGHEDAIHIMRGSQGVTSRDIRKIVHFPESQKPVPIVPKRLIEGVSERVDCFGEVVVPLNEADVADAIHRLVAQHVEAIAVCFLWSFKHSQHELRVKEMIRDLAPQVFVSCSVDIAPKWGEYERMTATALNAYIGPVMAKYLGNLDRQLKASGYAQPLQITQCAGGSISVDKAMESPLLTLDSGPVSGVTGSLYLGRLMDCPNIITTDMGGTSFDVGIIAGGQPAYSFVSNVAQYEYFLPRVDIQAIGSGGGSLARVDKDSRTLSVGPSRVPIRDQCATARRHRSDRDRRRRRARYDQPDNFLGGHQARSQESHRRGAAYRRPAQTRRWRRQAVSPGSPSSRWRHHPQNDCRKGPDPRDSCCLFGGAAPRTRVCLLTKSACRRWSSRKTDRIHLVRVRRRLADILHVYEQVARSMLLVSTARSTWRRRRTRRWTATVLRRRAGASSSRWTCAIGARSTRSRSCCRQSA
jgi:hypothetical protein